MRAAGDALRVLAVPLALVLADGRRGVGASAVAAAGDMPLRPSFFGTGRS
jgi:hypothetical protein